MNTSEKPEIIKDIEALWSEGLDIQLAPSHPNLVGGLMAFKENTPKYAVDESGQLIGLNLAETGIDDGKWQRMMHLLVAELKHLKALNLSGNQLEKASLPSGLTALQKLDISENQLTNFVLPDDTEAIEELNLGSNPLSSPPPEVVEQGSKGVLSWFASFKKDKGKKKRYLKEIKILLVGEGSAGKTSLLKQIKDLPFDKHENQTHGVNVEALPVADLALFNSFKEIQDVVLRIWDFGGQEIMHASHQFFLTHRSIYVFVLDSRTDNKKDYWLRHIQKFGGDSPAIVAINKLDENKNYSLEESSLNSKYPFIGNRFIKLSCKTGAGKAQFAEALAHLIPEAPLLKTEISESWLSIKNQLESETSTKQYINRQRFLEICSSHQEDNPTGQSTLLQYLNSLGVVLHFPSLPLQEFYVLDPHWVTIGVYKIINSPSITSGILSEPHLDYILNSEVQKKGEYDPNVKKNIRYSPAEQLYLISIMKEFELLYEYQKGSYLVPDLLPKEMPKTFSLDSEQALEFIMDYDFLPPNIIARFIIHMRNDVLDISHLWRYGAYLANEKYDCTALVIADNDQQRITILVNGTERRKREYFSIIRHALCNINEKFSNLKVTEKMPVPGHREIEYDYEELIGLEKMGEDKLNIGRLGKTFSVSRDFLDKISTKGNRQMMGGKEALDITINVDHRETNERLEKLEGIARDTEQNTRDLLANQDLLQQYLDTLLIYAEDHRSNIQSLFMRIDDAQNTNQELERINTLLEEQISKYLAELPSTMEIVKKWKETQEKLPDAPDAKWKWKMKIPFIFGSFEKELSWDLKAGLKLIRKEISAFRKGEKSLKELFIEDDE